MEASVDYFRSMAETDMDAFRRPAKPPEQLAALCAEIDAFEQEQAARVYEAYAVLAPMLAAYNEGDRDNWSEKLWLEVAEFRKRIPADLEALRLQAAQRVAAGETGIQLDFPEYPAFSWESSDPPK